MEGLSKKKKLLLFFTRHGERADKELNKNFFKSLISCDPFLTANGCQQGYKVGIKIG